MEFGFNIYTLLYIYKITKKFLLNSTGDYIQYYIITYMGKESEKDRYMYVCNCTPETNTTFKSTIK